MHKTLSSYKRRAFGQHFLKDSNVAEKIVQYFLAEATQKKCLTILEVGPGKGALTRHLFRKLVEMSVANISKNISLILCEKDHELSKLWESKILEWNKGKLNRSITFPWNIECCDFLMLEERKWLKNLPVAVLSNLPYSTCIPILEKLLKYRNDIAFMVLMFQSELARRIYAQPGSREVGRISLAVGIDWEVKSLFRIPPQAFSPAPKVFSEVLLFIPRETPKIQVGKTTREAKIWQSLTKVCFAQRRKMLRNILTHTKNYSHFWKENNINSRIDGSKRPESLSWDEWKILYDALNLYDHDEKNSEI